MSSNVALRAPAERGSIAVHPSMSTDRPWSRPIRVPAAHPNN